MITGKPGKRDADGDNATLEAIIATITGALNLHFNKIHQWKWVWAKTLVQSTVHPELIGVY